MPTPSQVVLLNKNIGSCRFVYNLALEVKNYAYVTQRKNLTCFDLIHQLPGLKETCPWLREVDSQALVQAIVNLDKAFTQFFKGYADFPKFKNKYSGRSFRNPHGAGIIVKDGKLIQAKFQEGINIIVDRAHAGVIKSSTITRSSTGKYYVSLLVETGIKIPPPQKLAVETAIGVDLGVKDFIVTSEGKKVANPKHLQRLLAKLKYLSRQYSQKKKGSKNRKKSQRKLASCYEKIANQRKDFLHKLSTQLVKNHDTLCFESLQIENMVKNRRLAQSIQSAGWGMFVEMCKYKAEWYGKNILQIPTFQASTKICSKCGYTNHTLTLADREWTCANCNSFHDRDINAAINIKSYSLKNCGGAHREKSVEPPTLVGAMNQKKTPCQ